MGVIISGGLGNAKNFIEKQRFLATYLYQRNIPGSQNETTLNNMTHAIFLLMFFFTCWSNFLLLKLSWVKSYFKD